MLRTKFQTKIFRTKKLTNENELKPVSLASKMGKSERDKERASGELFSKEMFILVFLSLKNNTQ